MSTVQTFTSSWPKCLEPTPFSQTKGTAWNAITTLSGSNFLHNKLAPIINPALAKKPETQEQIENFRVELLAADSAQAVQIHTADGALINGVFFPGSSDQAILFALGAGGRFESIANPQDAAHAFIHFFKEKFGEEINILAINTRGIDNDQAASIQGSALDYYSAWNFLESKGLNVLPWGHSLGFRYLVQAAAWKQSENPTTKINCVSDRSFDDIANEARQLTGGAPGQVVEVVANYAGWGGDIQADWNSLKGKKLILVAPEDKTVPYHTASFYKRIQSNPIHTEATVIKLRGTEDPHKRIYTSEEAEAILTEVKPLFDPSTESGSHDLAKPLTSKPQNGYSLNKTHVAVGLVAAGLIYYTR